MEDGNIAPELSEIQKTEESFENEEEKVPIDIHIVKIENGD
jgi:hypothetical protein